jgi:hypothetical protein
VARGVGPEFKPQYPPPQKQKQKNQQQKIWIVSWALVAHVILATWEAQIWVIAVRGQTPSPKYPEQTELAVWLKSQKPRVQTPAPSQTQKEIGLW